MTRLIAASLLSALLVVSVGTTGVRRALACSVGPDFDPVAEADVIVEGRFLGYEVLSGRQPTGGFVSVHVDMEVTRVFKGDITPETIQLIDDRTLTINPVTDEKQWGGGGSCGAFSSDPTGTYAIIGLHARDDGAYSPSLPLWFFRGDGPEGEEYDRALERMASFPGAAALPALGSGPESRQSPLTVVVAISAAAALALALGVSALRLRRSGAS